MVRIVSWNVNGVRTLRPSFKEVLDSLEADIICLQETRIGRADVDLERFALVDGYHSFFSFCTTRTGYSGVATYTRAASMRQKYVSSSAQDGGGSSTDVPNVTPVDAGEGFDGSVGGAAALDWLNSLERRPCGEDEAANFEVETPVPFPGTLVRESELVMPEFDLIGTLDLVLSEGRVVITDHGCFVLINIYAPAVSVESRFEFKLAFNLALELKVRALRGVGRDVVIVGDFNIAPGVLDVAEPIQDRGTFLKKPSRAWLCETVCAEMGFVDTFREEHPAMKGAYSCWSEATKARENNYGVRIDLVVANKELYNRDVQSSAVLQDVYGSDHCPVALEVRDGLFLRPGLPDEPPRFCSRFMRRFLTKQATIRSFFSNSRPVTTTSLASPPGGAESPLPSPMVSAGKGKETSLLMGKSHARAFRDGQPTDKKERAGRKRRRSQMQQTNIGMFFGSTAVNRKEEDSSALQALGSVTVPNAEGKSPAPRASGSAFSSLGASKRSVPRTAMNGGSSGEKGQSWQWQNILTGPPQAPHCHHREPCKLKSVKKAGENKGRTFYSCARPAGRWPEDRGANCNYFKWAPFSSKSTMTSL